mgnify:CR=1 FL=1
MLTKKIIKSSLIIGAVIGSTPLFALNFNQGSLQVWGGFGYGHNNIAKPVVSSIGIKRSHLAGGAGINYLMPIGNQVSAGLGISFLKAPDTTLNYADFRYTYTSNIIPLEVVGLYKLNSNWSFSGDAGLAYAHQDLNLTMINDIPSKPVLTSGSKNAWKPIVGVGIHFTVASNFDLGVTYKYMLGSKPQAFQQNTTQGIDSSLYRKIASQGYLLATIGYTFS